MEADPRIGALIGDRYRLDERLGAGGMGVVYKGVDVEADGERVVAVKLLHDSMAGSPELVRRFDREVAVMRLLDHPHLVGIVDFGVQGDVPYLVMDFHPGQPLSNLLDGTPLPGARAVGIARQVLAGVEHAHKSGVLHRDLKPDNILLLDGDESDDFLKVLDFGLAKLVHGDGDDATQLTTTGAMLGTPSHMSPEQASGTATDARSDIYAVGTIVYQMVVGRKPFVAESPMAVLRMHVDDPPVPPRQAAPEQPISEALDAVILRALEKKPESRWPTAAAFATALEETPEGRASIVPQRSGQTLVGHKKNRASSSSSVAAAAGAAATGRGRRPARWMALLAGVVVLGGGGAIAWWRMPRRDQQKVKQTVEAAGDRAKETWRSLASTKSDEEPPRQPTAEPTRTTSEVRRPEAPTAPARRPSRKDEEDDSPSPIQEARRLIAATKLDEALQVLHAARRRGPRNADVALLLGHATFRKGRRAESLREYETAVQLRPSLRTDRTLLRNAIAALDDPTSAAARALLRNCAGPVAVAELRSSSRDARSAKVKKRAGLLAQQLSRPSVAKTKGRR